MFWDTSTYMITTTLVFFMGPADRQILPDVVASYGSSDAVVPAPAVSILPPSLTGPALASILSVMMSTADSYLLVSTRTFVHDLRKNFVPKMTEKHEVLMSRVISAVLTMGALIIALYIKNAYNILMFAWSLYTAAAGLPSLAALYWKETTSQSIISAMTSDFVVYVSRRLAGNPWGLDETVPGALVYGILLVAVSLAACEKHPYRMA